MTKQKYLEELARHLTKLPAAEVEDILSDYREHFDAALRAGKSEEQISSSLGHPRVVAQSHLMTALINEVSTTPSTLGRSSALIRMVMLLFVLAPFNFLVVLGPFVASVALLIAGWLIPAAVAAAGVTAGVLFIANAASAGGFLPALTMLFMLIGTVGAAVLCGMLMWLLTRGFIMLFSSYIRWNFNLITARGA